MVIWFTGGFFGFWGGFFVSVFILAWSGIGVWGEDQIPVWILWVAVPAILVVGVACVLLRRLALFFPRLWRMLAALTALASVASAIICFGNGQAKYGAPFLLWALVLGATSVFAHLAQNDAPPQEY
jgi:hypothetical protein